MKVSITFAQSLRDEATLGDARFRLPKRAFSVLLFLYMQRPGRPIPCSEIADALAGEDGGPDTFEELISLQLWMLKEFGFPIRNLWGRGWLIEGANRGCDVPVSSRPLYLTAAQGGQPFQVRLTAYGLRRRFA